MRRLLILLCSLACSPALAQNSAAGERPQNTRAPSRPCIDATVRYGLRGDGVTNNTTQFAAMFSGAGQALCIKRGTYITSAQKLPANTYLYLEPGTVIQDAGVLKQNQRLFNIVDVSNVHIQGYGALLVMNRADYTSGEQRHGVMIRGGINITIEGLESSSTGGDGFYVGASPINGPSANVVLRDVLANNNRRQGLSIVSGRHVHVIGGRFTNTKGTSPQAGIDIEPNRVTDAIEDVRIVDAYTAGNAGSGILVLGKPTHTGIDVVIENHRDEGSLTGLQISYGSSGLTGQVKVLRPYYTNNVDNGIGIREWRSDSAPIEIADATVINPNTGTRKPPNSGNGIAIYNKSPGGALDIGNVTIIRPRLIDDNRPPAMKTGIYAHNFEATGVVNRVRVLDPIAISGARGAPIATGEALGSYIRDPSRVAAIAYTTNANFGGPSLYTMVSNAGATGLVVLSLSSTVPPGDTEYEFKCEAAQTFRLEPDPSSTIKFGRLTAGQYLQCGTPGATIRMVRDSATSWRVVSRTGEWQGKNG